MNELGFDVTPPTTGNELASLAETVTKEAFHSGWDFGFVQSQRADLKIFMATLSKYMNWHTDGQYNLNASDFKAAEIPS